MKALIVTADDFAYSLQITAGICQANRCGIVTETSILIRSPYALDAIVQGREVGLSMGLHIDLVSPYVVDRSLYFGPNGRFCKELYSREFEHKVGQLFTCQELIAFRDEMRRQIEDFAKLVGRLPTHLDYHYGLHHLPEIMAIYLILAETYAVPVRWGRQYAGSSPYPLAATCFCDRFRGREAGGVELFLSLVDEPWEGIMEVVVHPGYATPGELPDPYNGDRELELRTLTDAGLKRGLQERGIKLVNYDWLKEYVGGGGPEGQS